MMKLFLYNIIDMGVDNNNAEHWPQRQTRVRK